MVQLSLQMHLHDNNTIQWRANRDASSEKQTLIISSVCLRVSEEILPLKCCPKVVFQGVAAGEDEHVFIMPPQTCVLCFTLLCCDRHLTPQTHCLQTQFALAVENQSNLYNTPFWGQHHSSLWSYTHTQRTDCMKDCIDCPHSV